MAAAEAAIKELVHRETEAWTARDPEGLVSLFHPDTVWPWPPNAQSHDPMTWLMPLGRFNRERWIQSWMTLFETYELVHNRRTIMRVVVSEQGDAGFAVVDVDTLWRHQRSNGAMHWKGRACKVYTKVDDRWFFLYQTGLLDYSMRD